MSGKNPVIWATTTASQDLHCREVGGRNQSQELSSGTWFWDTGLLTGKLNIHSYIIFSRLLTKLVFNGTFTFRVTGWLQFLNFLVLSEVGCVLCFICPWQSSIRFLCSEKSVLIYSSTFWTPNLVANSNQHWCTFLLCPCRFIVTVLFYCHSIEILEETKTNFHIHMNHFKYLLVDCSLFYIIKSYTLPLPQFAALPFDIYTL